MLRTTAPLPLYRLIVFLFYIVYITMPYMWHRFMKHYIGSVHGSIWNRLEILPFLGLLVMVFAPMPTGFLCGSIIPDNISVARGLACFLFKFILLCNCVSAHDLLVMYEQERKDQFPCTINDIFCDSFDRNRAECICDSGV